MVVLPYRRGSRGPAVATLRWEDVPEEKRFIPELVLFMHGAHRGKRLDLDWIRERVREIKRMLADKHECEGAVPEPWGFQDYYAPCELPAISENLCWKHLALEPGFRKRMTQETRKVRTQQRLQREIAQFRAKLPDDLQGIQ